jgi:hypothetical protein
MPRKRVLAKARIEYGEQHIAQLRTGHDFFGDGFGSSSDPTALEAMRTAWSVLRDVVMSEDRNRQGLFHRPWAWWRFVQHIEHPPRDKDEQGRFLTEHGLLTQEERSALS